MKKNRWLFVANYSILPHSFHIPTWGKSRRDNMPLVKMGSIQESDVGSLLVVDFVRIKTGATHHAVFMPE